MTCMLGLFTYYKYSTPQVAVVDLVKLFNEFELKQQLEKADSITLLKTVHSIDSIKEVVSQRTLSERELNTIYQDLDEEYYKVYNESNNRINKVVWEKLNLLIKQFGEAKKVDVLVGANGLGSVVYYNNAYDITPELIKYVNENYSK